MFTSTTINSSIDGWAISPVCGFLWEDLMYIGWFHRIQHIQSRFEKITSPHTFSGIVLRTLIRFDLYWSNLTDYEENYILNKVLQLAKWSFISANQLSYGWILSKAEAVIRELSLDKFQREFDALVNSHSFQSSLIKLSISLDMAVHELKNFTTKEVLDRVCLNAKRLIKQGEPIYVSYYWIISQTECLFKELVAQQYLIKPEVKNDAEVIGLIEKDNPHAYSYQYRRSGRLMYKKANSIIETLAPLHMGATADESGNLNLIFRDQFTQTGIVPGSSIRGRLYSEMWQSHSEKEAGYWYGYEAESELSENTTESVVKFEYASILWLPVFCPGQPLVWVSCPKLLKRYKRIAGITANVPALYTGSTALAYSTISFIQKSLMQFNLARQFEAHEILNEAYVRGREFIRSGGIIRNPYSWLKSTSLNIIREISRKLRRDYIWAVSRATLEVVTNYATYGCIYRWSFSWNSGGAVSSRLEAWTRGLTGYLMACPMRPSYRTNLFSTLTRRILLHNQNIIEYQNLLFGSAVSALCFESIPAIFFSMRVINAALVNIVNYSSYVHHDKQLTLLPH